MGKKVRVALHGEQRRSAKIDLEATEGATVGVDLLWPDGTVVGESQIRNTAGGGTTTTTTLGGTGGQFVALWSLILNKPDLIDALAALSDTGFLRHVGAGSVTANEFTWTKTSVEAGEDITVPDKCQMLVFDAFTYDGGSLTLDGELVVLSPSPDALLLE